MKNAITVILITAIVVVTALFFMKNESGQTPRTIKESAIAAQLPEETTFLLKFSSIKSLFDAIGLEENKIWHIDLAEQVEGMKEEIGCNLYSTAELEANGISADKEAGIFSTYFVADEDEPQGAVTFFLPVSEDSKLKAKLIEELKSESDVSEAVVDGITTLTRPYDETTMNYTHKGDYFFFTIGFGEGAGKAELKKVLATKNGLAADAKFIAATKNFSVNETVFAYANIIELLDDNKDFIAEIMQQSSPYGSPKIDPENYLKFIQANEAAAASISLDTKDLIAAFQGIINEKSDAAKMYKGTGSGQSPIYNVSKKPLFFTSTNMNFDEYVKSLISMFNVDEKEFEAGLAAAKEETGVDFKEALLENTGNNMSMAMYGADEISMGKYNALITLNVKDGKKLATALNTLMEQIPAEPGTSITKTNIKDVEIHKITSGMGMVKIYLGVHDNNFIVTTEKPIFKEIINGSAAQGFTSNLKAKEVKSAIKSNSLQVLYVDIDEVGTLVKNLSTIFLGMQAAFNPEIGETGRVVFDNIVKEIQTMNYIFSDSRVNGNTLTSDVVVSTDFDKNFSEGLANMIQNIIKEASALN